MDHTKVKPTRERWYGRLQVQLSLWFVLPLILVLVALTLNSAYNNQEVVRSLTTERNLTVASLYAQRIDEALTFKTVLPDGQGLPDVMGQAQVGQRGVAYIVDVNGHMLFHPDPAYPGLNPDSPPAVLPAADSITGTFSSRFADGSPTLVSYATVTQTHWRVLVEEPIPDAIVPLLRASTTLPLLLVAAGLLSLLIIDFSLQTIVRPLRRLTEATSQIAWGDLPSLQQDVGGVEEIRHLQQVLRDMVDRIRSYQDGMRSYVDAVTQGQETERNRLSRELHDETVQDLIAITQRLELTQHALEHGDSRKALGILQGIRSLILDTLNELRRLIRALRPVYLEDLGFLPGLETLVRSVCSTEQQAEIQVKGEPRRLPPATELAAFRVAQEALTNAMQHAQARHVTLTITFLETELVLNIEDNGTGFVMPDVPGTLTQQGHLGLVGMRERVLLAGGRLDIQSQRGKGTWIAAHLPIPADSGTAPR